MKILIVSSQDINSGAGRAAYRLMCALRNEGVEVKMLVRSKFSSDPYIIGPVSRIEKFRALILPFLDLAIFNVFNRNRRGVFSSSLFGSSFVLKNLKRYNADIVHLHWVNGGTFKLTSLEHLEAKIVWSMHDEWLYTGVCHVAYGCDKYVSTCSSCPGLASKLKYDLSYFIHSRKKQIFKKEWTKNLTVVGLSTWIVRRASISKLLSNKPIIHLPNCIDSDLFKPINRNVAKDFFGLDHNAKIIMFGAVNALSDINKGYDLLVDALQGFKSGENLVYLVLGGNQKLDSIAGNRNIKVIPHKYDEETLVLLYNCSDVVVVPSRQENLSNTIMESISCGCPVVAFDTGGNSDLITHKVNGYLAKPFDSKDLFDGINYVIQDSVSLTLRENARQFVLDRFTYSQVAKRYIDMYQNILQ